jgi:hypothetical protein
VAGNSLDPVSRRGINLAGTILLATLGWGRAVVSAQPQPRVVDWGPWDAILREHVRDGAVDYDGIAREPAFAEIVEAIAGAALEGRSPASVLAFYINAYNVLSVQGILRGHSPCTTLGRARFFGLDRYTVAGERLTLHKLEHQRIRPLGEPRIHFAIVCASVSCPPLRDEAYRPEQLDRQLDDNARRFLADPSKNRFDLEAGEAYLSKIFKWFAEDFETAAGSVSRYVADYVTDPEVARALREEGLEVRHLDYDWSLNGRWSGGG